MPPSVSQALAAMRGKRALLVGDPVLDAYIYGETVRVSREAPVIVVRKERVEHRLGGAANTAANLAALGLATEMVALVGDDDGGKRIGELLARGGVTLDGLSAPGVVTPVKTRVLAGAYGTSRQQVLRIDDEPREPLGESSVARLAEELERRAKRTDVVVISDYGLGLAQPPLLEAARRIVASGTPVCVDSRYALRQFRGVTAVTPNVPESESVAGFAVSDQASVERAGPAILSELECTACLITQGRNGMTLFRRDVPSAHVDIVGDDEVADVTGAGDTVIATFSAALAAGVGMDNGMRLANVAAGIVVAKVGTATASPEEIEAQARRHGVTLV